MNPVIDFVRQGFAPAFAPPLDDYFLLISESLFLRLFIIVDFPIFGIPPIIVHAPTVLKWLGQF